MTRKQRAIEIIEQIISDRANREVSSVELLYRCQEIASLLELSKEDALWIELELYGYPTQNPFDKVTPASQVPLYRRIELPVILEDPREQSSFAKDNAFRTTVQFLISYSCGQLESASEPLPIGYSQLISVSERGIMGEIGFKEDVPFEFSTNLPLHLINGIISAVRGRINKFALSHYIALRFEEPLGNLFDASRGIMADRLSRLHNPLLSLIEETLTKQERSTDSVEWQDVLENTRNIIRTFTEHVSQHYMLNEGEDRPNLNETKKKTAIILRWIKDNADESIGNESDYIDNILESLTLRQKALINLINKLGHPPASVSVEKGDVDRIVLSTIIWISDLIALLDKAQYRWEIP